MPPWIWMFSAATWKYDVRRVGLGQRGDHRDLGGVLGHRGRRVGDRRAQRLDLEQQVGAAVLDRLEAADRPPELVPGLGVVHGHVQGPLGAAELLGGQRDRGDVQGPGQHRGGRRPGRRSAAPGHRANSSRASLRVWSSVGSARRSRPAAPGVDREQRQPGAAAATTRIRSAVCAVQDEALVPVQHPAVAALGRGEPDRLGFPGPVVFGEGQRGHGLAGGDAGQQLAPGRLVGAASSAVAASTALARYGPPYSAAPSSSSTMACSAKVNPAPPYCSGIAIPCRPSWAPACCHTCRSVPPGGLHELADPGHGRPVGQEPPHRIAQLPLFRADAQVHGPDSDLPGPADAVRGSAPGRGPAAGAGRWPAVTTSTSSASTWSPLTHSGLTSSARSEPSSARRRRPAGR